VAKEVNYYLMCKRAYEVQKMQNSIMGTLLEATGNKNWVWMPKKNELMAIAKEVLGEKLPHISNSMGCPELLTAIMNHGYSKYWSIDGEWSDKIFENSKTTVPKNKNTSQSSKFKYHKEIFEKW